MTRKAETLVTLIGAALVALTTLGLSLLDRGDWPVGLIGLGVLLALGASGLLAADRPWQPLGPSPPHSRVACRSPLLGLPGRAGGAERRAERGASPPATRAPAAVPHPQAAASW